MKLNNSLLWNWPVVRKLISVEPQGREKAAEVWLACQSNYYLWFLSIDVEEPEIILRLQGNGSRVIHLSISSLQSSPSMDTGHLKQEKGSQEVEGFEHFFVCSWKSSLIKILSEKLNVTTSYR